MTWWRWWRGEATQEEFAARFVRLLRRRGDRRALTLDPTGFAVRCESEDGAVQLTFLQHAYAAYQRATDPFSRRRAVMKFVDAAHRGADAASASLPTREEVLEHLLPRVRDRMYYASLPLELELRGHQAPDFVQRPIAEHMAAGVVLDYPDRIEEIPRSHLEALGIGDDQAFEVALANLRARSEDDFRPLVRGLYVSPWQDHHDGARMLLTDRLERLSLRGPPVVMVPNRDVLLVAGADDADGLAAMITATLELLQQPRFSTAIPSCLIDGAWVPFVPDASHPLGSAFARLRVIQLVDEYARQKRLLDQRHEQHGIEIFVARLRELDDDTTGHSYCTWTKDVPSLLPRAECIALLDPTGGEPVVAPWHEVARLAGDLMQSRDDVYPPRVEVRGFPEAEVIARLREATST